MTSLRPPDGLDQQGGDPAAAGKRVASRRVKTQSASTVRVTAQPQAIQIPDDATNGASPLANYRGRLLSDDRKPVPGTPLHSVQSASPRHGWHPGGTAGTARPAAPRRGSNTT
jgi:hypothetical protein